MGRKKSKNPFGRPPLYLKAVSDKNGLWHMPGMEGSQSIIPAERATVPFKEQLTCLTHTCYFCGRVQDSKTFFIQVEGSAGTKGVTTIDIKGYGLKFREKTWVYHLCPECQSLLALPELKGNFNKETDMKRLLILTGRAMKTGNETKRSCYFCGRHEGTDSISLRPSGNGNYDFMQAELFLHEVVRALSDDTVLKYYLCSECEVLLGLSPRIVCTDGGMVEGESLSTMLNKYTDIENAKKDKDFVKKAAMLINCIGPEEYMSQLLSSMKDCSGERK